MSVSGGRGSSGGLMEKGESIEVVGEEEGGVQRLRHETAEMSPTSNSCEPNYIKSGS